MTVDEVRARVAKIAASANDDEMAHGDEDALHQDVLYEIAGGADNAAELAAEALKTCDIKFCRWCA